MSQFGSKEFNLSYQEQFDTDQPSGSLFQLNDAGAFRDIDFNLTKHYIIKF